MDGVSNEISRFFLISEATINRLQQGLHIITPQVSSLVNHLALSSTGTMHLSHKHMLSTLPHPSLPYICMPTQCTLPMHSCVSIPQQQVPDLLQSKFLKGAPVSPPLRVSRDTRRAARARPPPLASAPPPGGFANPPSVL
jgi:hypothetical protein